MRSVHLAMAVAFGCSACLVLVDTTGLTGGSAPDSNVVPDAAPIEAGGDGDGGVDATTDAPVDAGTYRDLVMADSPVLYLRLGETSGTVAKDERGLHNGAIDSDVVKGQPSLVKGETDPSMTFGESAFVIVPAFDGILAGTKPYSIEAWILVPTMMTNPMWILGRDDVNMPRYGNSFLVDKTQVALEQWQNGSNRRASISSLPLGAPTHVVATFDGSVIQVFMNGVSSGGATPLGLSVSDLAAPLAIGSQSAHLNGYFYGTIDEVALYDHVLPNPSIQAHYERGKP